MEREKSDLLAARAPGHDHPAAGFLIIRHVRKGGELCCVSNENNDVRLFPARTYVTERTEDNTARLFFRTGMASCHCLTASGVFL